MPTINLSILILINLALLLAVCREAEGDEYQGIIFSKNYELTGNTNKMSEKEFEDLLKSVTRYEEESKYGTVVIFYLSEFADSIYDCKENPKRAISSVSCFYSIRVSNKDYHTRIENAMKVLTRLESLSSIEKLIDEGGCSINGSVVLINLLSLNEISTGFESSMATYDNLMKSNMDDWDKQECPTVYMFLGKRVVDDCFRFSNEKFEFKFCKIYLYKGVIDHFQWSTVYQFEWVLDVSEPNPGEIKLKFLRKKSRSTVMTINVKIIKKNGKYSYEIGAIKLADSLGERNGVFTIDYDFNLQRKIQCEEGQSVFFERIVGIVGLTGPADKKMKDSMIMTSVQMRVYPQNFIDEKLPDFTEEKLPDFTDEKLPDFTDEKLPDFTDEKLPDLETPSQEAELVPIALIECFIVAALFIAITFLGIIALMSISPITRFEDPTKPQVPVNVII